MEEPAPKLLDQPRWEYRFHVFGRALALLRHGLETLDERPVTELEREGLIQRFEYTWELGWNLIGDYLDFQGVILPTKTPRTVLKVAYERGIIANGPLWMKALDARNRMAHTYSFAAFEEVLTAVREQYFALLNDLWDGLIGEVLDGEKRRREGA